MKEVVFDRLVIVLLCAAIERKESIFGQREVERFIMLSRTLVWKSITAPPKTAHATRLGVRNVIKKQKQTVIVMNL